MGSMEKGACNSEAASGPYRRFFVTRIGVERARGSPKSGCEVWPEVRDIGGMGSRSPFQKELSVGMAAHQVGQGSWVDSSYPAVLRPSVSPVRPEV